MDSLSWRAFYFFLLLGAGWGLEQGHSDSFRPLVTISDLDGVPLPVRVGFVFPVQRPHFSGTALVMTIAELDLTCYFRHPPATLSVFGGDVYSIRARIEPTPLGKLCVVEEMRPHVDS